MSCSHTGVKTPIWVMLDDKLNLFNSIFHLMPHSVNLSSSSSFSFFNIFYQKMYFAFHLHISIEEVSSHFEDLNTQFRSNSEHHFSSHTPARFSFCRRNIHVRWILWLLEWIIATAGVIILIISRLLRIQLWLAFFRRKKGNFHLFPGTMIHFIKLELHCHII